MTHPTRKLYLGLDCHLFMELPHDVEEAIAKIEDSGKWPYGMLCTGDHDREIGVEHAKGEWNEFEPRARRWLTKAIAHQTAADIEIASWYCQPPKSTAPEESDEEFARQIAAMDAEGKPQTRRNRPRSLLEVWEGDRDDYADDFGLPS